MINKAIIYIRGGLGDIWPTLSAIRAYISKNYKLSRFGVLVVTDSVYYFRTGYPPKLEKYSIDMIRTLSNNIITIPPSLNNNFELTIDDTEEAFCQEEMDKNLNEFMFWRPEKLKTFIKDLLDENTLFIDSLCTEGIFVWDNELKKYNRIPDERARFTFIPNMVEKYHIDHLLNDSNATVIHVRVRDEKNQLKYSMDYYNRLIKGLNEMNIIPVIFGIDMIPLEGEYHDLREGNMANNILSFDTMGYLMTQCKVLIADSSGLSLIKQYDQNWDNLIIFNVTRMRTQWWDRAIKQNNSFIIMDGKEDNVKKILNKVKEFLNDK